MSLDPRGPRFGAWLTVAALAALTAALLNAAFGLCLACKVHPLIRLYPIRRPQGAHS